MRDHLSRGICPSGQQWAVPQARAGELETLGHKDHAPGRGGAHVPLPGPIGEGQGFLNHLKEKMRTLMKEERHGLIEMQGM